jgi:hypothetical protein
LQQKRLDGEHGGPMAVLAQFSLTLTPVLDNADLTEPS